MADPYEFKVPKECPHCGCEEPSIKALEVMNAYSQINFDAIGVPVFETWDPDGDSMLTQAYIWDCCHEELPEEAQKWMDQMLGNERWDITWTPHKESSDAE